MRRGGCELRSEIRGERERRGTQPEIERDTSACRVVSVCLFACMAVCGCRFGGPTLAGSTMCVLPHLVVRRVRARMRIENVSSAEYMINDYCKQIRIVCGIHTLTTHEQRPTTIAFVLCGMPASTLDTQPQRLQTMYSRQSVVIHSEWTMGIGQHHHYGNQ